MTTGGIYLKVGEGLVELQEVAYETEDLLQQLLADHPKLLAGEQIDVSAPRRWALIRREATVPDTEGGGARWSVDHLFLDQDGVPTLVEVKRSSDTRLRREVVGQMLDYAANAVVYWPIEKLITEFEATCDAAGMDPGETIAGLVAGEMTTDDFWRLAKTNLQAGRIRMIFVADIIPHELRRVVEFLNEQLDPAEVYAVEVRQFAGEGTTALVPRLIGATAEAQERKGSAQTHRWTKAQYLDRMATEHGEQARRMAQQVLVWVAENNLVAMWGSGATGSMRVKLDHDDVLYNLFNIYADGRLELPLGSLKAPYETTASRQALVADLNRPLGGTVPSDGADRFPQVRFVPLLRDEELAEFLSVWMTMIEDVRAASGS